MLVRRAKPAPPHAGDESVIYLMSFQWVTAQHSCLYPNPSCRINEHDLNHFMRRSGAYLAETERIICRCSQMNNGHS